MLGGQVETSCLAPLFPPGPKTRSLRRSRWPAGQGSILYGQSTCQPAGDLSCPFVRTAVRFPCQAASDSYQHLRARAASRLRPGTVTWFATVSHPVKPKGWDITWGTQVDPRVVRLTGDGEITDVAVASYLAKYATKS